MFFSETDKRWHTGYVSGAFDMFHIGHLNLIRRAKGRCDYLIAGVLTDETIAAGKKKWPVIPLKERMEIIAALKYVDETDVTTESLLNKITAWEKYRFDAMFSGDDHINDGWGKEEHELKKLGADLVFFPYTKEVSTTFLQDMTLPPKAEDADKARKIDGGFRHLFPFDKVSKGERVIIYGAGRVGGQYARQLAALNFCELVAFADTYAGGSEFEGKLCLTPEELLNETVSFDRIVIAAPEYQSQILDRLRSLGVGPERIV